MTNPHIHIPKWKKKLNDSERMAALGATSRLYRVSCPYCQIGAALVAVDNSGGELKFPLTEPVRCEGCKQHFQLKVQVQLRGARINGS